LPGRTISNRRARLFRGVRTRRIARAHIHV
jgi:hypothetical protein